MRRRSNPPPGFTTIDRGMYMSVPATDTSAVFNPNDSSPSVILIFGWMGATTRHLQHYTRKYSEIYPNATQVLVKCGASVFWSPSILRRRRLRPIAEVLESLGCLPSNKGTIHARPRVLIHSFSNGGGYQLWALGRLLASKYPSVPPSELLHSALILDSSPAVGNFQSIGRAFSSAIKNTLLRCIALPMVLLGHVFKLACHKIAGTDDITVQFYKQLLKPNILPWMGVHTPRLYIFSQSDEIVPWKEVQRHADAAKALGIQVHCELYEKSAHVNHMRTDPDRYWSSVQELWKDTCIAQTKAKTITSAL